MIVLFLRLALSLDFRDDLEGTWFISPQSMLNPRLYKVDIIRDTVPQTLNGSVFAVDGTVQRLFSRFQGFFSSALAGVFVRSTPSEETSEFAFTEVTGGLAAQFKWDEKPFTLTYIQRNDTFSIRSHNFGPLQMIRGPKPTPPYEPTWSWASMGEYGQWIVIVISLCASSGLIFVLLLGCDKCCSKLFPKKSRAPHKKREY
jgi:hypothetical protein